MTWDLARMERSEASVAEDQCSVSRVEFRDLTPEEILAKMPEIRNGLNTRIEVANALSDNANRATNIDTEISESQLPQTVINALRKFDSESIRAIKLSGELTSSGALKLISEQAISAIYQLDLPSIQTLNLIEQVCTLITNERYGTFQIPKIDRYMDMLNASLPVEGEQNKEA